MDDKTVERYKVWPTQVDRFQMKTLVDSGSLNTVTELEQTSLGRQRTGVEPFMIVAYKYFHQQIADFVATDSADSTHDDRIETLFHTLKHDLALVSIELEGGDDPQVIFETLNGFNEPLLPTDLLRNFAFQRAYRENVERMTKHPMSFTTNTGYHLINILETRWKQGRLKRPRADIFFNIF